jgi:hypothetical protein
VGKWDWECVWDRSLGRESSGTTEADLDKDENRVDEEILLFLLKE